MTNITAEKRIRLYKVMLWLLSLFLLISISSNCAFRVKLVGKYDEIVDNLVTDLQEQTSIFFSKMKEAPSSTSSYEVNKEFYDNVQAKISALILRSEVIEEGLKRKPLTKNFKDLQLQYKDLAEQHKKEASRKYFESAEKAFDQSFRAILENLLYLKWNQTQPKK